MRLECDFLCFCPRKDVQVSCRCCNGGQNGGSYPGRIVQLLSSVRTPVAMPSRPAALCRAPAGPATATHLVAVRRPTPSRTSYVWGLDSTNDNSSCYVSCMSLRSWLLTCVPSPVCFCKSFSCRACPGIYVTPALLHMSGCSQGCLRPCRRIPLSCNMSPGFHGVHPYSGADTH